MHYPPNPLRESLTQGRFCYVVELVASRNTQEIQLLDTAAKIACVPNVVAGSVTSYAGGAPGHDPIRIGAAVRARGLNPNVHLTCVSQDRIELRSTLEYLSALGIENVFALTGDYPKNAASPPIFDLDSVQLINLIAGLRKEGHRFWTGAAVSPFKYTEADCAYQYLKMEKKIAAGADYLITQLGYDVHKFRELKRYLNERIGAFPVLGSVYVLNSRTAERMSTGHPPGCWVSASLLEKIKWESQCADRGKAASLERAAQLAAVLRGLNYAGAYIGGTADPLQVQWIIDRAESLFSRWEELVDELVYAPSNTYYFYGSSLAPDKKRALIPWLFDQVGEIFPVKNGTKLRPLLARIFSSIEKHPVWTKWIERTEFAIKSPMFGCQACGNCILGTMEYVCPQTCPKQMRNGPCGGTHDGRCEVVDKPCIWVSVYDRAKAAGAVEKLKIFVPPPNRTLKGTSSWINYFLDRDARPYSLPAGSRADRDAAPSASPKGGSDAVAATLTRQSGGVSRSPNGEKLSNSTGASFRI